jgi:hypothetical protein
VTHSWVCGSLCSKIGLHREIYVHIKYFYSNNYVNLALGVKQQQWLSKMVKHVIAGFTFLINFVLNLSGDCVIKNIAECSFVKCSKLLVFLVWSG